MPEYCPEIAEAASSLTADAPEGRLLLTLIEKRIAIYSPHTAFDSARQGINQRLAEGPDDCCLHHMLLKG